MAGGAIQVQRCGGLARRQHERERKEEMRAWIMQTMKCIRDDHDFIVGEKDEERKGEEEEGEEERNERKEMERRTRGEGEEEGGEKF